MNTFVKVLTSLILSCCAMSSLTAETLGNIEYQLPQQGAGWKILPPPPNLKTDQPQLNFISIWVPENSLPKETKEAFVAHKMSASTNLKDQASLKDGIERGMRLKFPDPKATVTVLEETPDSVLYEFSVTSGGEEKEHGWIRIFSTPESTTMLTYQTELVDQISEKRDLWLPTLKDAKVINP